MCLIVIGIIWMQSGIVAFTALFFHSHFEIIYSSITVNVLYFVFAFLIAATWFLVKRVVLKASEASKNNIELLQWKRNPKIFLSLLNRQKYVNVIHWDNDLIMGNPDAPVQLMAVCNPYCGPCAKTHKELTELIENYSEQVGLTVRFTVKANNKDDKRAIAVKYILTAYNKSKSSIEAHPVDVWFDKMNIDSFKKVYNFLDNNKMEDWNNVLEQYEEWCNKADITYTPTIFLNGFELPKEYSVKSLQLLISTITEFLAPIPVTSENSLEVHRQNALYLF